MLETLVFFSGALVMVLEMVASRVLAPHLGTSIIVWTSLIGVVLAFLALGSFLGGRLADKKLSRGVLSNILLGAAFGVGLTALLHYPVARFVASTVASLHMATLCAAVVLLALPALFFGMVAPYTIRLRLKNLAESGSVIGRLYALSTAGSIIGTFLGGFVLVSWFSSTQILAATAVGMLLLSFVARLHPYGGRVLGLLCFASVFLWQGMQAPIVPKVIETAYNSLTIQEGYLQTSPRLMRFLITDPSSCQSAVYADNPVELALAYTRFYDLGALVKPEAASVLMLGGGGYSVPRHLLQGKSPLNRPGLHLDVVEIDPGITRTAREYFGIPDDSRLRIFNQDARAFLNANENNYDLVFMDVFGSAYSTPFHVGTVEAMEQARRATAPGGALIMNVISSLEGEESKIFQAIYQGLAAHFAELHVFGVRSADQRLEAQNIMILALPEKRPDLERYFAASTTDMPGEAKTISHMLARRVMRPIAPTVPAFTDEYAPADRYSLPLLADRQR